MQTSKKPVKLHKQPYEVVYDILPATTKPTYVEQGHKLFTWCTNLLGDIGLNDTYKGENSPRHDEKGQLHLAEIKTLKQLYHKQLTSEHNLVSGFYVSRHKVTCILAVDRTILFNEDTSPSISWTTALIGVNVYLTSNGVGRKSAVQISGFYMEEPIRYEYTEFTGRWRPNKKTMRTVCRQFYGELLQFSDTADDLTTHSVLSDILADVPSTQIERNVVLVKLSSPDND